MCWCHVLLQHFVWLLWVVLALCLRDVACSSEQAGIDHCGRSLRLMSPCRAFCVTLLVSLRGGAIGPDHWSCQHVLCMLLLPNFDRVKRLTDTRFERRHLPHRQHAGVARLQQAWSAPWRNVWSWRGCPCSGCTSWADVVHVAAHVTVTQHTRVHLYVAYSTDCVQCGERVKRRLPAASMHGVGSMQRARGKPSRPCSPP
jgi:hypothetical protein